MPTYGGNNSNNTLTGSAGNDDFFGYGGQDTINAGAGDDTAYGGNGNDSILGQAGNDILFGELGNDRLFGGTENDSLYGGTGNDSLDGGTGNDLLQGEAGNDTLIGGTGSDTADYSYASGPVTVNLTTGSGTSGSTDVDTLTGIENVIGSGSADSITGNTADNTVTAGSGSDTVTTGAGDDSIDGGDGDDVIDAGVTSVSPVSEDFNWSLTGADEADISGGVTQDTGNVTVSVTFTNDGNATEFSVESSSAVYVGTETFSATSNLYLGGTGAGDTSTTRVDFAPDDGFEDGVRNLQFRLNDIDMSNGNWQDVITIQAFDADGNPVAVTFTISGNDSVSGNTITAADTSDTATSANGSVLITIAGPVSWFTIDYNNTFTSGQLIYVSDLQYTVTASDDDTVSGGAGNDSLTTGAGNDILDGGTGNDRLFGGSGIDTLTGGDGADSLEGGTGNDQLFGGQGLDTLLGDAGNDSLDGGTEDDRLFGGQGLDMLLGGDGADSLDGGTEDDQLFGGIGNDTLLGQSGNDSLDGGDNDDRLEGGDGNDSLSGGAGNDLLYGGIGDDTIYFGAGDDTVYGDTGNDLIDDIGGGGLNGANLIYGGAGNDTVWAGLGNDTIHGDAGRDSLSGEDGNDILYGGADADTVYGGAGNDTLYGGAGADSLFGDADRDRFNAAGTAEDFGDTVQGGGTGDDFDTLDLSAWGKALTNIYKDPMNPENGYVEFLDAFGAVIGTMTFTDIETIIPCFTPGTLIATDRGEVPVESLRPGDLVATRDNGLQPIRWVGRKELSFAQMLARPALRPVRIAAGAMGLASPARDMFVSPQHRVLFEGPWAEMLFGEAEVLVAATHLVGRPGVDQPLVRGVTYIHLMLEAHEVILSDGLWTESFQPAARMVAAMDADRAAEILALFPDLPQVETAFPAARPTLKAHEARVLLSA